MGFQDKFFRGLTRRKTKKGNVRRLSWLYVFFVCAFTVFSIRIFYIQQTKGEEYSEKTMAKNGLASQTIPFRRGSITDRNGTLLATSEIVYDLVFDCKVINAKQEYRERTLSRLCELFPDLSRETMEGYLDNEPNSSYKVLKRSLSYEEVKELLKDLHMDPKEDPEKEKEEKEKDPYFKGVTLETRYKRIYPFNTLACDVLGFLYNDGSSAGLGIEGYYNKELNGVNGRKYQYMNDGNKELVVKEATDGYNVVSTIDYNVQSIVEKHLVNFDRQFSNGVRPGNGAEQVAVMIANPNNGEILAEANFPYFDLNDPRNLMNTGVASPEALFVVNEDMSQEEQDSINEQKLNFLRKIWRNFCVSDSYEPGSTQKPFTVAAALEMGKISGDETFFCDGFEVVGTHRIRCVNRSGHGEENVSKAISNSCNDVLMQIGARIGVEGFIRYQNLWGFGKKTNVDLPSEFNCRSLVYTLDTMHETELATSSFGQGYNVTMTQMMAAFCSLINGGNYYQPHVVKKITDVNGSTVKNVDSYLVRKTVSRETSELVKSYLYDTVMSGTGKTAHVDGYSMGGKTGTAEKVGRDKQNYVVSFMGYVPADDPQIAIYVVIDSPNVADQAHSSFSQQIAHDILAEVLPYLNIFPDMEVTSQDAPAEGEPAQQPEEQGQPTEETPAEEQGSVFDDDMTFPLLGDDAGQ